MNCPACGHWCRCPACQGWACEVCGAELPPEDKGKGEDFANFVWELAKGLARCRN